MSQIHFNLHHSATLQGMAPAPVAGGGFGVAALPPGMAMPGTYIIVNTTTNNRYIGIAGNIAHRFNTRLATVTEMGFGAGTMAAIGVTWGATGYQDTGSLVWHAAAPAPPLAFAVRWRHRLE